MYSYVTLILVLAGVFVGLLLFIGLIISLSERNSRVPRPPRRSDDEPLADDLPLIPNTGARLRVVSLEDGHFHPEPLPEEDRTNIYSNPPEERGYGMD